MWWPRLPVNDGFRNEANPSRNARLSPNGSGARPTTPVIGATRRHSSGGADGAEAAEGTGTDARFPNSLRHTVLTRLLAPSC